MGRTRTRGRGEGAGSGTRVDTGTGSVATEFEHAGARSQRGAGAIAGAPLRGVRTVARYLNAVLGGQDYARYVAHLRRKHPDRPIPTEREYWRERHAAADRNPGTRCC